MQSSETALLATTFGAAARRTGHHALTAGAWTHTLSLELGWMPPGDARRFVAAAQAAGVLRPSDEQWIVDKGTAVPIPRGFRPDPRLLSATADLGAQLENPPGREEETTSGSPVADAIAAKQALLDGRLSAEVAAIWVSHEEGDSTASTQARGWLDQARAQAHVHA